MKKGPIIYLNGVTSSGKSSIAEALRKYADFYYLSDDVFEDHIADTPGDRSKNPSAVAEGFIFYN